MTPELVALLVAAAILALVLIGRLAFTPGETGSPEARMFQRPKKPFKAQIFIPGQTKPVKVRGLELHESGAAVLVRTPLEVGTPVHFRNLSLGLAASSTVRNCTKVGRNQFRVGIGFHGVLDRPVVGGFQVAFHRR